MAKSADPAAPAVEFYKPPPPPKLGNPETDLPLTIRIQPPLTWERACDPLTPRVVKLDMGSHPWAVIDLDERLPTADNFAHHDDVRDWPIQHFLIANVAMGKLREGPRESGPTDLVGDMGEEAFYG